jgi:3,4-dihydroxy 2-butanone 4-phosphate synthase/GTP cyclohydrolase II
MNKVIIMGVVIALSHIIVQNTHCAKIELTEYCKALAQKYDLPLEKVTQIVTKNKDFMRSLTQEIDVIEHGKKNKLQVTRKGIGLLVTDFGLFYLFDFNINDQWQQYYAIVKVASLDDIGNPIFANAHNLAIRIDSGCQTGQLFGDKTCECKEQLELAMEIISNNQEGMIISIPCQDGRGMGLPFKLATLSLQHELGVNTVESAQLVAEDTDIDIRSYGGVIAILKFFNIQEATSINLATNNPKKTIIFKENGYQLKAPIAVIIPPTEHTKRHLQAKKQFLGHDL